MRPLPRSEGTEVSWWERVSPRGLKRGSHVTRACVMYHGGPGSAARGAWLSTPQEDWGSPCGGSGSPGGPWSMSMPPVGVQAALGVLGLFGQPQDTCRVCCGKQRPGRDCSSGTVGTCWEGRNRACLGSVRGQAAFGAPQKLGRPPVPSASPRRLPGCPVGPDAPLAASPSPSLHCSLCPVGRSALPVSADARSCQEVSRREGFPIGASYWKGGARCQEVWP